MSRSIRVLGIALVTGLLMVTVGAAQTGDSLELRIAKRAALVGDGASAEVRLRVSCPPGSQLQESLVYLVQDGNTSQFSGFPVACDGRPHVRIVTVRAFEETPFHEGRARASAYMEFFNPSTGETESVSPTRIVRLRAPASSDALDAKIARRATLVGDGSSAEVEVTVTCPPGRELQESLVYLVQDGNTSQFSGLPVICDGRPHVRIVTVRAFEETPFHQGRARASAYVLLYNPTTGETESVSPTRIVRLR